MRREPVILRPRVAHDRARRRTIVILHAASERVGHQLLGQRSDEQLGPAQERRFQAVHVVELAAIRQAARGIDGRACLDRSPPPDRVVVLEREAERIHHVVARRTVRVGAVLRQPLAHRQVPVHRVVLQRGHIGQRRRGRHAEKVVEHALTAKHRRRSGGVRRHRQDASLTKQSAALAVLVQRHTPEAACHTRSGMP